VRCAGCSGDFLTASPPGEKATARQDLARKSSTGDGAGDRDTDGKQLRSELSTGVLCGVDVEIGQPAFDSPDQRRLGLREPAREGIDEIRVGSWRLNSGER
jgi:hypothetical protein